MPDLSVRKLDKQVYEKLRIQAAKHGLSMEEEVRQILSRAVAAPKSISAIFENYFGVENGIDLDISTRADPHSSMDFER